MEARAVNTVAVPHIADIQCTLSDGLEPAALDVRLCIVGSKVRGDISK
jgi:hypothetical protein